MKIPYYTLFKEMFFFRLHLTLYQGKSLFFISLCSVVFLENPKKQHYQQLFVYVFYQQQNFISNETFLPLFIHFFLMRHSLICLIKRKTLLNLEIYKRKRNSPLHHLLGTFF